jgi:hypothetical protein
MLRLNIAAAPNYIPSTILDLMPDPFPVSHFLDCILQSNFDLCSRQRKKCVLLDGRRGVGVPFMFSLIFLITVVT